MQPKKEWAAEWQVATMKVKRYSVLMPNQPDLPGSSFKNKNKNKRKKEKGPCYSTRSPYTY